MTLDLNLASTWPPPGLHLSSTWPPELHLVFIWPLPGIRTFTWPSAAKDTRPYGFFLFCVKFLEWIFSVVCVIFLKFLDVFCFFRPPPVHHLAYGPLPGLHLASTLTLDLHLAYTWPPPVLHMASGTPPGLHLASTWPPDLHLAIKVPGQGSDLWGM